MNHFGMSKPKEKLLSFSGSVQKCPSLRQASEKGLHFSKKFLEAGSGL
jgi:hypothetical protein